MLHAGLDLSRKKVDVCLLSETGEHLDRAGRPTRRGLAEEACPPNRAGPPPARLRRDRVDDRRPDGPRHARSGGLGGRDRRRPEGEGPGAARLQDRQDRLPGPCDAQPARSAYFFFFVRKTHPPPPLRVLKMPPIVRPALTFQPVLVRFAPKKPTVLTFRRACNGADPTLRRRVGHYRARAEESRGRIWLCNAKRLKLLKNRVIRIPMRCAEVAATSRATSFRVVEAEGP